MLHNIFLKLAEKCLVVHRCLKISLRLPQIIFNFSKFPQNSRKFTDFHSNFLFFRCKLPSPESTEVFYIDYGNTEPIDELLAVKTLDKDFFVSPAYSVPVSTPVRFTAEDLTPLITAVDGIIFDAVFARAAANEWSVDLNDGKAGKTFAQYAVESGCGAEIERSETQPGTRNAFADWRPEIERKVIISHVASPTRFYVQSLDDADKIAEMQRSLQSALKKLLPVVGDVEGLYAAQMPDRSWCRARVSRKGKTAFAVDSGAEFTPSAVKKLPKSYLLDAGAYVAECALNVEPTGDAWSSETTRRLTEIARNACDAVAKLEYVKNGKYVVDLVVDGTNVSDMLINEGAAKHKSFKVVISHAVSLKEFYIQETESQDLLFDLAEKMQGADDWETAEPNVGDMVAAKFVDDELWYRAVVVKADDGGRVVRFVDYGNESPCEEFRVLPEELKAVPVLAVRCSQHPLPENADELSRRFVTAATSDEGAYSVYFLSHVEPKLVMLFLNDVSIDEALQQSVAEPPQPEPQPSAENDAAVSHVNSPSSFYTQAIDDTLSQVEASLADVENAEAVAEPVVGDVVGALFPDDGLWYRAKVTDTSDGNVTVFFVDYGNSCVVEQLRKLEENAKTIPFLATHCALRLPSDVEEWSEAANTRFVELAAQGATAFKLVLKEDGYPTVVDLLKDGASVTDQLVALCSKVETTTNDSVAVCHINSPSSFYVQAEDAPVGEVSGHLVDIESREAVAEPAIGDLVAALFPDDCSWYRAKIVSKEDETINVQFVDFGNLSVAQEFRHLSEEAKAIPPLARHCALTLPVGLERWPEAATQRLSELACDGNTIFKLVVKEEGDPTYVDLQENDVSVADELATLCKADLTAPVRETTNQPAVLSHVQDNNDLWIQYQTPQLDEMINEMANAETFDILETTEEGTLVAALFDDDGLWYRAKVTTVKEEGGYRVLFIDYGNEADTTALRSLPEDLISLPPLAKHCRLEGLSDDAESCPEGVFTKLMEMVNLAQVN